MAMSADPQRQRRARQRAEKMGRLAEWCVSIALTLSGHQILATRFKVPQGEIDSVARRGDTLIFVEVKARKTAQEALDAVTPRARRRIEQAGRQFLARHPKLNDQALLDRYRALADEYSNVTFVDNVRLEDFQQSDVMLCDSSSIILEFMMMNKPVVTYRNTNPGQHLLNVTEVSEVENAIETALTRPASLMKEVNDFAHYHEAYRDGRNCERILDAVDDFNSSYKGKIKAKPLNLWRKFRLRNKLKYWK